jgi:hypothetical protein
MPTTETIPQPEPTKNLQVPLSQEAHRRIKMEAARRAITATQLIEEFGLSLQVDPLDTQKS